MEMTKLKEALDTVVNKVETNGSCDITFAYLNMVWRHWDKLTAWLGEKGYSYKPFGVNNGVTIFRAGEPTKRKIQIGDIYVAEKFAYLVLSMEDSHYHSATFQRIPKEDRLFGTLIKRLTESEVLKLQYIGSITDIIFPLEKAWITPAMIRLNESYHAG